MSAKQEGGKKEKKNIRRDTGIVFISEGKQGKERIGKGTGVSIEWEIGKCKDQLTFLFPAFVYRIVHVEGNRETRE